MHVDMNCTSTVLSNNLRAAEWQRVFRQKVLGPHPSYYLKVVEFYENSQCIWLLDSFWPADWQLTCFFLSDHTFRGKKSYSTQFREIKQVSWMLLKHTGKATVFSQHPLTGIPRSWGSTGCRKGKDSGSCRYRASRVGIRAWRNSSGLKTAVRKHRKRHCWQGTQTPPAELFNGSWGASEKAQVTFLLAVSTFSSYHARVLRT